MIDKRIMKVLVFAVILLFIGMSIIPVIESLSVEKNILTKELYYKFDNRNDNDTTPPVTTINFFGEEGENGWYVYMVDVWFTATDDQSGVNNTFYRINGGEWEIYTKIFFINYDGIHIIEFYSVDNAGNVEEVKSAELKIDQLVPFIDLVFNRIGLNKWVFIATCFDDLSGMDRVEFYCDDELMFTDYEKPYEWVWTNTRVNFTGFGDHEFNVIAYDKAGNSDFPIYEPSFPIIGIILNPQFSEYSVSFFAVIVKAHTDILKFENITLCTIGFRGYIGEFFISGYYKYGWLPD